MELDFNEIRELLAILNQTDLAEISIKSGDFELTVRKEGKTGDRPSLPTASASPPQVSLPPAPTPTAPTPPPPPAPVTPPPSAPPPPGSDRLVDIVSPMVGTFYRSPGPDEPPFVDTGDRVRPGQTVCIIEAMKLMNEIEAEVSGEIVEVLARNGEPVEYGQILMRVNPT